MMRLLIVAALLALSPVGVAEEDAKYLILPGAVRLEGIGPVYGVGAGALGLAPKKRLNIVAGKAFGTNDGYGVAVTNIPLFFDSLSLGVGYVNVSSLELETTYSRGVAEDRPYRQKLKGIGGGLGIDYKSAEQMVVISLGLFTSQVDFDGFRNLDNEVVNLPGGNFFTQNAMHLVPSITLNFLDDIKAPRQGIRLKTSATISSERTGQSDQLVLNNLVSGYVPATNSLTIAARLSFSDAMITKQNPKYDSTEEIEAAFNIDCSGLQETQHTDCENLRGDLVQFVEANNKHGTAAPIGGSTSLRSYREGRFKAAKTRVASLELRWDLSQIIPTPFLDPKDRSGLELTPFYDVGFAADYQKNIYKKVRRSYGASLRVLFKGLPLRLGRATSKEADAWFFTAGYPF